MAWTIQELGLGEVLDHSFQLLRRCFDECMLTALVVTGPLYVINVFLDLSDQEGLLPKGAADFWNILLFLVFILFLKPLAYGIILPIFAGTYLGEPVTRRQAFRLAKRRYLPLVLTRVLRYVSMLVGFVVMFFPGIICYCLFYFVEEVILLEGRGYFSAMNRSAKLAGKSFGLVAAISLLSLLGSYTVLTMAESIDAPLLRLCLVVALSVLFLPIEIVLSCVTYFSARCARDQFDLELAVRRTDSP